MNHRPIFVLGLARSGTNLLARMLDRHPQICVALDPLLPVFRSLRNAIVQTGAPAEVQKRFNPEAPFQDFYFDIDGSVLLDTLLRGTADLSVSGDELAQLRESVQRRAGLESPQLARQLQKLNGRTYVDLFRSAFSLIAKNKPEATWIGVKEVWVIDFVPLLARAFPDARFYAIERDPRAIVASILAMADRDPTQAAHPPSYMRHWRKNIALARMFGSPGDLRKQFRALAYEELVVNPEVEAKRLCKELDIDYHPDMLALSAEGWTGNSSFAEGKDVYASSMDRWRESLPVDARRAVDYLCGPEMALTGYRPDSVVGHESEVGNYLRRVQTSPASWRSSSGDPAADFAGEMLRYKLLGERADADPGLIRRCFLFAEVLAAIREARQRNTPVAVGGKAL